MIEIPLGFRLDVNGELLQDLAADGPMVIMDAVHNAAGEGWATHLDSCAELIVPRIDTLLDEYIHQAFFAAGVLACESFRSSDAPETMVLGTLKQISLAQIPALSHPIPLKALANIARTGHAAHPEFKDHTDFIMEYYCKTTQQPQIAQIAFIGAGVALNQLDHAWVKARDLHVESVATQAVQGLDWDSLPWSGAGEQ